jgi:hypothetical protein
LEEGVRGVVRWSMDRLRLIELIEDEVAKLSPHGRELWQELEVLVETSPPEENTMLEQVVIAERMAYLPLPDQHAINLLTELYAGLYESYDAENRGESGEAPRDRSVIRTAMLKDRHEGRQIDPYMTLEQALARLRDDA